VTKGLELKGLLQGLTKVEMARESLRWIHASTQRTLSKYSTSYDEDMEIIGLSNISWSHRTAVTARSRAKMILMKVLQNLKHRIESNAPHTSTSWRDPEMPFLLPYTDPSLIKRDALATISIDF
jgi:hypothetical protein